MAVLVPFRALRPTPSSAADVAAVPYDVISTDEARTAVAGAPLSFLHVSRAEIDLPPSVSPYADEVYAQAASNLQRLTREAPLVIEDAPSLYVYRLRMGDHEQTGIAGCFAVDEYEGGVILRHELTRKQKEDDRTRHILAVGAQTGPVFLTYRASAAVRSVTAGATGRQPLFDFEAGDAVRHTLWKLDPAEADRLVSAFGEIPALYIADGHHRAAAAARARRELRSTRASGDADSFLAVAFPHDEVQVLAYNRVIADLGRHDAPDLLAALRQRFPVAAGGPVPATQGDVSMFLGDRWYTIAMGAPSPELAPDDRLDVSRLQQAVLTPLLGIGDVTVDTRIDFVGGGRGTQALESRVRSGAAAVAFSMYPVTVEEIMAISDAGGIMPPKSSWFEPKLRDGLLSHLI